MAGEKEWGNMWVRGLIKEMCIQLCMDRCLWMSMHQSCWKSGRGHIEVFHEPHLQYILDCPIWFSKHDFCYYIYMHQEPLLIPLKYFFTCIKNPWCSDKKLYLPKFSPVFPMNTLREDAQYFASLLLYRSFTCLHGPFLLLGPLRLSVVM